MTVTLNDAVEIIAKVSYPKRPHQTVELRSGPGIGKTESIYYKLPTKLMSLYKEIKKVVVIVIECSGIEPSDAHGFAIPQKLVHPGGREDLIMTYARPDWWPAGLDGDSDTFYVIFLDEWSKTPPDVKKVFAPIINEGRVGQRMLPKNSMVVMASNRSADRSGDYDELAHLQNRRMALDITPSLDDWEKWAIEHDVHPLVVAFANRFPETVFRDAVPNGQGAFCTPRSLVRAHDALRQWVVGRENWPHHTLCLEALPLRMVAGWIGEADCATFAAFAKTVDELPTPDEIIRDPVKAKLPSEKRPDASLILCTQLALGITPKTAKPFMQYMARMQPEFQVAFVKKVYNRTPDARQAIMTTQEYANWASKNSSVIMAATALQR